MTTPTNPNLQSPSGGSAQPPPKTRAYIEDHGCSPIIASCGCQFTPCNIGLVGSMILPHLDEPHFTTVMRNAIQKCEFDEETFQRIHRMLGIDPSPEQTNREVRNMARIPWLLGHRYPTLPNRLEVVIRSAIQADDTFSGSERQHCFRMLGMDEGAVAARNRHRECPTCGTPEGYRMDGGPASASDRWRGRPSAFTGQYAEQPWQVETRNRMLARRQPASTSTPVYQGPRPPPRPIRFVEERFVGDDRYEGPRPAPRPIRSIAERDSLFVEGDEVQGPQPAPRPTRSTEELDSLFDGGDDDQQWIFDREP